MVDPYQAQPALEDFSGIVLNGQVFATVLMLAGEVLELRITYDASGDPAYVATGNAGQYLVSNGAGAAPTFQAGGNPVGTVIWYAGATAPTGYLKANGDTIANGSGTTQSITANFSALYAIVGNKLPDLRGEFIRGFDDGKGTDSGRAIRSTQTDQNESHTHTATSVVTDGGHTHSGDVHAARHDSGTMGSGDTHQLVGNSERSLSINSATTGISVATTNATQGGTEARPRNVALLACIKY